MGPLLLLLVERGGGREHVWPTEVLEDLPAAIYLTDAAGRITFFNKAAVELAGCVPTLGSSEWCLAWNLYEPDGTLLPYDQSPMAVALKEARPARGSEVVGERPDGTRVPFIPFATPLLDRSGKLTGSLNMLMDITERKKAEARIEYLAQTDLLTNLPNRFALQTRLDLLIHQSPDLSLTLVRMDLEDLKQINDRCGHGVGDQVLREVCHRMSALADGLFLARVGGDEFAMIVPGELTQSGVSDLVERLHGAVNQDMVAGGQLFRVRFRAAAARYPEDASTGSDLLACADEALDQVRHADRVALSFPILSFYDAATDRRSRVPRSLEQDLLAAIDAQELHLQYQPQSQADGSVVGFEALLRWDHPEHGMIAPNELFAMAENCGLIIPLSRWILREGCREAASWPSSRSISINLSPVEFQQENLIGLIRSLLAETGLEPNRLILEVTEGVIVSNYARARKRVADLRACGVQVALDNFGAGDASLSYLQDFPLSEIKIDRSYVANLGVRPPSEAIIKSVITLGHALKLRVVAKGVETTDQLHRLVRANCDIMQGYLIGRPSSIETYKSATDGAP
jgi:diguanylate cyclase (GGDEF)-like protein